MTRPPRHLSADAVADDRPGVRYLVARGLVVAGRVLPVLAVVSAVAARATRDTWLGAAPDASGSSSAWLPQVATLLVALTVAALPWLALPVVSSALARIEDDTLTATTVLGRREVGLHGARLWRARVPGEQWGTQVVVVRGRPGLLVVTGSELWVGDAPLLDDGAARWRVTARGVVLLAAQCLLVLVGVGVGGTVTGSF
ncbi:hypothetical protein [Isoptericola sp. NPDC055881]